MVILGLIAVLVALVLSPCLAFMEKADAVAALVVAVIVIYVSGQLGMRSIQGLLDAAPKNGETEKIIETVNALKEVNDVHAVRIRTSGAGWFVDMHVTMDRSLSVEQSHMVTEKIETAGGRHSAQIRCDRPCGACRGYARDSKEKITRTWQIIPPAC